jgi:hypothetical protein
MDAFGNNLDAYRLILDSYRRVREIVRTDLRAAHGDDWETRIPTEQHGFLSQRQARESALNWRLSDGDDVLDYAGFADLHEVISADDSLLTRFAPLAADAQVLRLRFLELDSIGARIAYGRPISDRDLELLLILDERLKKIAAAPPTPQASAATATQAEDPAAVMPPAAATGAAAPSATEQEVGEARNTTGTRRRVEADELTEALAAGNDRLVLLALYDEVTVLADGLWTQHAPPRPRVWQLVRESTWYRERFSPLRLKPVSDFYDLIRSAGEQMAAGASRTQMQDFLRERSFAQILLSLRDVFQSLPEKAGKAQG